MENALPKVPTPRRTVRSFAAESFSFLRRHPALALPVLFADLLGFTAMHVQHALQEPPFALFLTRKASVLGTGSTTFVLCPQNASTAYLIAAPLLWTAYFLTVCFYATALFLTSDWIKKMTESKPIQIATMFSGVRSQARRIVGFALRFFVSLVVFPLLAYPAMELGGRLGSIGSSYAGSVGYLTAFLAELLLVYFFAAPALQLLMGVSATLNNHSVSLARLFGCATIIAQYVFLLVLNTMNPLICQPRTIAGLLLQQSTMSLLAATPYIIFFVVLSLVAEQSSESPNLQQSKPLYL